MRYNAADYYGARNRGLHAHWWEAHLDTRPHRIGFSFWVALGRAETVYSTNVVGGSYPHRRGPGLCLDVRAPFGEPNRLFLSGLGLQVIIGLWPGHGSQGYSWRHREYTWKWHWIVIAPERR